MVPQIVIKALKILNVVVFAISLTRPLVCLDNLAAGASPGEYAEFGATYELAPAPDCGKNLPDQHHCWICCKICSRVMMRIAERVQVSVTSGIASDGNDLTQPIASAFSKDIFHPPLS